MMHDEKYGSLEENVDCGYGHSGKHDGHRGRHHEKHRKHESRKERDYDRMDESIGMREYEMNR